MDIKFKDNSKLKFAPFTQLEYIESTGTQYIDTRIKADNNNLTFKIGVSFLSNSQCIGSGETNRPQATANIFRNDNNGLAINWGAWSSSGSVLQSNYPLETLAEIEIKAGNVVKLNGNNTTITAQNVSFSSGRTANFILNGNSQAINKNIAGCVIRTHYFIVENAGVEILHLMPAKTHSGVVCLYDIVSETFFYNQGTGDFIAGPIAHSTIVSLPETILLKTTTIYHKNTPNVSGRVLLNSILEYQKTHQDEVKECYYPTTQLWQDIIIEYPDILYWYNIDHKFCIYICESDDPEQCAEDFLDDVDDIQQELEDYPDLIPIIAENPSLALIIAENPEVIHSLIDTGYETWLQADGSSWIVTNYYINGNTDVECRACILNYDENQNASPMLYGGASSYKGIGGEMYGWSRFTFEYYNNEVIFTTSQVPINVKFKAETTAGFINISLDNGTNVTGGSTSRLTFTASVPTVVFALNRGSVDYKSATSKLSSLKFKEGAVDKLWLVPIQNNGNPCMIDLLTGTKYLNQGTGSFTYSLEPKNA